MAAGAKKIGRRASLFTPGPFPQRSSRGRTPTAAGDDESTSGLRLLREDGLRYHFQIQAGESFLHVLDRSGLLALEPHGDLLLLEVEYDLLGPLLFELGQRGVDQLREELLVGQGRPVQVWVWRKALGVGAATNGTSRLRSAYCAEPWFKAGHEKSWAKADDPGRREKIAAAKRGVRRP
jgi:hypothetical protein